MKNRRKLANIFVDARAQLRLAAPFLILLSCCTGLVSYLFFTISGAIKQNMILMPGELLTAMSVAESHIFTVTCYGVFVIGILCTVFWLLASHRIFGPMVQIQRQLEQFNAGDFSIRSQLRKHDEFKPLSDQLNQLGEKLSKK